MKRIFVLLIVFALLEVIVGPASADTGRGDEHRGTKPKLDMGRNLTPAACGRGRLVVNVRQRIMHDADKGIGGDVWALDSSVDTDWYGWHYQAVKRGTWIKSSQGNSGDIK